MRILFIAPQAFADAPDARDVTTLAKVLRRADHSVDLVSPLYSHVDTAKLALARRLTKLEFDLGGRAWACELYTGRNPDGVGLTFIGNEEVLLSAESLSDAGDQLDASRVGVFASAVAELLKQNADNYDVVHAHGAAAGAVIARLREALPELASVLTVYDASQQGSFDEANAEWLGLSDDAREGKQVSALKAGKALESAQVSPKLREALEGVAERSAPVAASVVVVDVEADTVVVGVPARSVEAGE